MQQQTTESPVPVVGNGSKQVNSNGGQTLPVRPEYQVRSHDSGYTLTARMPGVGKADLRVSVENGVLEVVGNRDRRVEPQWRTLHREIPTGPFELHLRLGDRVDSARVQARLEAGILTVELPLSEAAAPRAIEVQ